METAQQGGFSFDLCKRNEFFAAKGVQHPGFTKTGTTIAGLMFKVRWRVLVGRRRSPDHCAAPATATPPAGTPAPAVLPACTSLRTGMCS